MVGSATLTLDMSMASRKRDPHRISILAYSRRSHLVPALTWPFPEARKSCGPPALPRESDGLLAGACTARTGTVARRSLDCICTAPVVAGRGRVLGPTFVCGAVQ